MAKSKLANETVMYSINPGGGEVIAHHLPWSRDNPVQASQLQKYVGRGYTFEKPVVSVKVALIEWICPDCGRVCKSAFGLQVHSRVHSKGRV